MVENWVPDTVLILFLICLDTVWILFDCSGTLFRSVCTVPSPAADGFPQILYSIFLPPWPEPGNISKTVSAELFLAWPGFPSVQGCADLNSWALLNAHVKACVETLLPSL